jgi:hypothetical protein
MTEVQTFRPSPQRAGYRFTSGNLHDLVQSIDEGQLPDGPMRRTSRL